MNICLWANLAWIHAWMHVHSHDDDVVPARQVSIRLQGRATMRDPRTVAASPFSASNRPEAQSVDLDIASDLE
jgi:hypothetical protein